MLLFVQLAHLHSCSVLCRRLEPAFQSARSKILQCRFPALQSSRVTTMFVARPVACLADPNKNFRICENLSAGHPIPVWNDQRQFGIPVSCELLTSHFGSW